MQDIWRLHGKDIFERVSNTLSLQAKISLLEKFLMARLAIRDMIDPVWDHFINKLQKHRADTAVDSLTKELNISYWHFRRRFIVQTSTAPKHFQQLSRFHATLKPSLLSGSNQYLSYAAGQRLF